MQLPPPALHRPKILCNPVDKNNEGITDPQNHLLCYAVEREDDEDDEERSVLTFNQFGPEELEVEEEEYLCVPSTKTFDVEPPIIITGPDKANTCICASGNVLVIEDTFCVDATLDESVLPVFEFCDALCGEPLSEIEFLFGHPACIGA